MTWQWVIVVVLVLLASLLAMAEASLTRMTRVRALALREDKRRNSDMLVKLEEDPARALNPVYLAVMLAQNGSAILVAILSERYWDSLGVTLVSIGFTLLYFVLVEAMAKTYGVLHSDRVALTLSPLVFWLGRLLALPTRALIGFANILLPGRGLPQGPFMSEHEIRSMAEVGHEEGSIEEEEKELIHSIFEFGDTIVREVMVPRPDIIAVEDHEGLRQVQEMVLQHGYSRLPVYKEDLDEVLGVAYAKDVLKALHQGRSNTPLREIVRRAHFVPESKKVADLLKQMQRDKFHIAMVTDEYGSVSGLVTLEDILEELVGEITDEYDVEEPNIEPVGDDRFRVNGRLPIDELEELLDTELPHEEWDTVGGLLMGLIGDIPWQGQSVDFQGVNFKAEKVQGRRIAKVLITRTAKPDDEEVD
ncbi:MAG: hemolysin family protein [Actinobacteria bacterium]|nr:hemolysin family protein [Actinomycetota bacterium]